MSSNHTDDQTNAQSNDPWLEVLAGRATATDLETRQAAKARDYYLRTAEADMAAPLDEQRLKRLQNMMDVQAAERRASTAAVQTAATERKGLWASLNAWFNPPQGGGLRYAGATFAVMALAAVLVATRPPTDDDQSMKGLPPGSLGGMKGLGDSSLVVVSGGQPLARALTVQAALQRRNITAEVMPLGDKARLDASIPAEQQTAVREDLSSLGIIWPGGAGLSIEFRSSP